MTGTMGPNVTAASPCGLTLSQLREARSAVRQLPARFTGEVCREEDGDTWMVVKPPHRLGLSWFGVSRNGDGLSATWWWEGPHRDQGEHEQGTLGTFPMITEAFMAIRRSIDERLAAWGLAPSRA